ncbi:MAG: methylaspartate ammonia-lyase [Solirubrobacteraceae bacterium]
MTECCIVDVLTARGDGAFFFDDQAAIRMGARHDGFAILGDPLTPGFHAVRQPAEAVSVMLRLSDGYVAVGDCVSVQYSGVGGREPVLRSGELADLLEQRVAPELRGRSVESFRETATITDQLAATVPGFGAAAAYGLSQALLAAAAHAAGATMTRVIQNEWELDVELRRVPIYAQCGEQRRLNVDKMILRRVDSLPHGLINNPSLVGVRGHELIEYVSWVSRRVIELRHDQTYSPILHFDVYGVLGIVTEHSLADIVEILIAMETAARPFSLRVEHPLDAGSSNAQIEQMAQLRDLLRRSGSSIELVADEWANTLDDIREFNRAGAADMIQIKTPDLGGLHHSVEAVLDCRRHGVLAHIGGSCAETDRSARACVHVALATGADQILAKPGMGVDEGLTIVGNEMARTLRLEAACTTPA